MKIEDAIEHAKAARAEGLKGIFPMAAQVLADELIKLRYHLTELGKAADAAGLVLATLEAENSDEEERIRAIIDGISQWALPAILTPCMACGAVHPAGENTLCNL